MSIWYLLPPGTRGVNVSFGLATESVRRAALRDSGPPRLARRRARVTYAESSNHGALFAFCSNSKTTA